MTTSRRPQQRYDHRLREFVRATGNVTLVTDLGVLARRPVAGSARLRRSSLAWTWRTWGHPNSNKRSWRFGDACGSSRHSSGSLSPRALDDQSSCPRTSPHRLTPSEVRAIKEMVTAVNYL